MLRVRRRDHQLDGQNAKGSCGARSIKKRRSREESGQEGCQEEACDKVFEGEEEIQEVIVLNQKAILYENGLCVFDLPDGLKSITN